MIIFIFLITLCLLFHVCEIRLFSENTIESAAMTAEQQGSRLQQVRICSHATATGSEIKERSCLPSEYLRHIGIFSKIPPPPLPTLKWGLERSRSWLHPFWALRYIACTWAPLGWPCLPTRCSITGSIHEISIAAWENMSQPIILFTFHTICLGREIDEILYFDMGRDSLICCYVALCSNIICSWKLYYLEVWIVRQFCGTCSLHILISVLWPDQSICIF